MAFYFDVAGYERGTLVLDVRLTAAPSEGEGLFLCVAKSGRVPDTESRAFNWASALSSQGSAGWRCCLSPHRWIYASADATVLVAVGSTPPPRPMWCHGFARGCVSFAELEDEALPLGPPVSVDASLAYEPESLLLPTPVLRAAHSAFHSVFSEVDGIALSDAGKKDMEREGDSELTYGEVQFFPYWKAFRKAVQPRSGEVFVDLGSGTGRAVIATALGFPSLKRCVGLEVVPQLHWAALNAAGEIEQTSCETAPMEFHESDFLAECTWPDYADIVWISSLCMTQKTLAAIEVEASRLKKGARVVTMDAQFGMRYGGFEQVPVDGLEHVEVEMSFGDSTCYVVRRV